MRSLRKRRCIFLFNGLRWSTNRWGRIYSEIRGVCSCRNPISLLYYANYKVRLTAELQQRGGTITGSRASDYIIYTNAKILTTLVQPAAITTP